MSLAAVLVVATVVVLAGHSALRAAGTDDAKNIVARLNGCGGTCVSFSHDGSRILTAGKDAARVWDARTFRPLSEPLKHGSEILTADLNPDGTRVITTGGHVARVWDVKTNKRLFEIDTSDFVCSAALSPDGSKLITGGSHDNATIWDLKDGRKLFTLSAPPSRFYADQSPQPVGFVTFSPGGARVLGLRRVVGYVWDANTGRELIAREFDEDPSALGPRGRVRRPAAFSPDAKYLISIAHSWLLVVSEEKTGRGLFCIDGRSSEDGGFLGWSQVVAFSPDGKRFAAASFVVAAWDWKDGKAELLSDDAHRPAIRGPRDLVFSPDGKRLLVAAEGGGSGVYNIDTGEQILCVGHGTDDNVPVVAFSPDGTRVASAFGTEDRTVIWEVPGR